MSCKFSFHSYVLTDNSNSNDANKEGIYHTTGGAPGQTSDLEGSSKLPTRAEREEEGEIRREEEGEMRPRKVKHNQDKLHSTLLYTEDGHLMTRMCPDSLIKDNSKHYTVSV